MFCIGCEENNVKCWMPTTVKISGRIILTDRIDYKIFSNGIPKIKISNESKMRLKYLEEFRKHIFLPENFVNRKPERHNYVNIKFQIKELFTFFLDMLCLTSKG